MLTKSNVFINRYEKEADKTTDSMSQVVTEQIVECITCSICHEILSMPINLKCGSSVCKRCIPKLQSCLKCQENHSEIKVESNFLLTKVINKWFPKDSYKCLQSDSMMELAENLQTPRNITIDPEDFQCSICTELLMEPVCTTCGHSFCFDCVQRVLDYNNECPLCKQEINISNGLTHDQVSKDIIVEFLTENFQIRLQKCLEDVENIKSKYPIFVCTLALPSVHCPLHIFEPRYRLLARRSLEYFNRTFGMVLPQPNDTFNLVGTSLYIKKADILSDGRSILKTVGYQRFHCVKADKLDGYSVATKLETIKDDVLTNQVEIEEQSKLNKDIYSMATSWFETIPVATKEKIIKYYGEFPTIEICSNIENGPNWHWWFLNILPVDNQTKSKLLEMTSYKSRLLEIKKFLHAIISSTGLR